MNKELYVELLEKEVYRLRAVAQCRRPSQRSGATSNETHLGIPRIEIDASKFSPDTFRALEGYMHTFNRAASRLRFAELFSLEGAFQQ